MSSTIIKSTTDSIGKFTGQCKWFNDQLGYGFVTVIDGDDKGSDIFVHHSGINPLNSQYKTLRKGEYINFNTIQGTNGPQAVDITGIKGGPLMCDINVVIFKSSYNKSIQESGDNKSAPGDGFDFTEIVNKSKKFSFKGKGKGGKGKGQNFANKKEGFSKTQ